MNAKPAHLTGGNQAANPGRTGPDPAVGRDLEVRLWTDAALLALTLLLVVTIAVPALGMVRPVAALACMCMVPGWAILTLFPRVELSTTFTVSIALSLAVETIASVIMVNLGLWHPFALASFLGVPSTGIIIFDIASIQKTR